ncbi:MAG TPA: hypothetical protein VEH82_10785 [Acidimicrobiales bacterium]|nr:hypothetical protein [Acidimicrobiales bacterium]
MTGTVVKGSPASLARASLKWATAALLFAVLTLGLAAITALLALVASVAAMVLGALALYRGRHAGLGPFRVEAILSIVLSVVSVGLVLFVFFFWSGAS